jgi:hypothetical protein
MMVSWTGWFVRYESFDYISMDEFTSAVIHLKITGLCYRELDHRNENEQSKLIYFPLLSFIFSLQN